VTVNEAPTFRADQMPYGGIKGSGNTKEGPAYTIREMTEERLVVLQAGRFPFPARGDASLMTRVAIGFISGGIPGRRRQPRAGASPGGAATGVLAVCRRDNESGDFVTRRLRCRIESRD
jgi:hypothetical protein